MNKLAIIGGGIAGLALAIGLKNTGIEVNIYEKSKEKRVNGHAFMLLENGINALTKLGLGDKLLQHGQAIYQFSRRNPNGDKHLFESLNNSVCIRRAALIELLTAELPSGMIKYNKIFSHFKKDETGQITHASFLDGTDVEADAFIGADGIWSKTRSAIFPDYKMSPVRVREIVSVIKAPQLVKKWQHTFLKTQTHGGGLAIGMLPCDDDYLVWYIQYDSQHPQFLNTTLEEQKSLLYHMTRNWAAPISELYKRTDFAHSYTWHTTDMETLPYFHKSNVALVGDAAHIFLTFTSQGVNTALEDAVCLADLLIRNQSLTSISTSLKQYTYIRKTTAESHLEAGRLLQQQFLYPQQYGDKLNVPVVINQQVSKI